LTRFSAIARLTLCVGAGIALGIAGAFTAPWQVALLLAWDAVAAAFCIWMWIALHDADAEATKRHATADDDSRPVADLILIAASLASLPGVGFALVKASSQSGAAQAITTLVAVLTVALSWLAVHTVFTIRYAHEYSLDGGGIDFNADRDPDYGDFAYVAFTVGMTYQVSDTNITSNRIRMTALRHALLSYVFGIAVIATTINVVASLLSG
jgi:uncharacterized membrane protein